jgi:hypothetical protein
MDLTTREPQVMVGRTVKIATVAFAIAVGVHGLDHLRRGLDVVPMPAAVDGTFQMILRVIVAALVLREHRWSLTAATLLGFGGVILFGQAHLLPHWGPFSDSFISAPGVNLVLLGDRGAGDRDGLCARHRRCARTTSAGADVNLDLATVALSIHLRPAAR